MRVNLLICVQCVDSSRCLCSPMMVVTGHTGNQLLLQKYRAWSKVWTFFKQRLNKMVLCTLCETEMACRDSSPTAALLSRSIWKENILGLFYLKMMRLQHKYLDYNLDFFYIALEYGCQSHILLPYFNTTAFIQHTVFLRAAVCARLGDARLKQPLCNRLQSINRCYWLFKTSNGWTHTSIGLIYLITRSFV